MRKVAQLLVLAVLVSVTAAPVFAQADPDGTVVTRLRSFDEVPAVSTSGNGRFEATISDDGATVDWTLTYGNLESTVTQAHIHFAQRGVNGGIVVFLCSNLGNGPAGTQACPAFPATIHGTFHASDVVNSAASQSIVAGELPAVLRAIRAGIAYANVHTTGFPGGEIRGQLSFSPADGLRAESAVAEESSE
jgi:hypothetical protein